MNEKKTSIKELEAIVEELRYQLSEANETIEAIRTGQVDAIVVQNKNGHALYTLQSADAAYRVFIEKMTEGAINLNRQGIILYCNSQFASMVGLPISQVIGSSLHSFVNADDSRTYKRIFEKSWSGEVKGEVHLEYNGRVTPVQLSVTPLELEGGTSLSIILTDLTSQKKDQEQLARTNRQLEEMNRELEISNHELQQFASVASHDLQEPLRKIQMFSDILKESDSVLQSPESRMYMNKIIASASRMRTLIVDVLNFSKLSGTDNTFTNVQLDELVAELIEDFELVIQQKNATIEIGPLPAVSANRGQMRQVLQNILSNALKFTREGVAPVIRITGQRIAEKSFDSPLQEDGPFGKIRIRDNGIGFDPLYVGSIFTLFERLHSKDIYEGSGIGLAISKKIIEKHNGLITATGEQGKGAEFTIILPVQQ